MAGIGNISKIEMDFMNSMINLSRAYQNNSKLVAIKPITEKNNGVWVFIPKSKIISIVETDFDYYILRTEYDVFHISKQQADKLIKEW